MSILKIEAFSGLSGDMFLGALADLTGAYDELAELPGKLGLTNIEVKISPVEKAGIACRHIKIIDKNTYKLAEKHSHSHDQSHTHSHGHDDGHTHGHAHNHEHTHVHHTHAHGHTPHRHLKDIVRLINNGKISDNAKKIAKQIFQLLGEAESKVHGVDINTIHFHEVGAIDLKEPCQFISLWAKMPGTLFLFQILLRPQIPFWAIICKPGPKPARNGII